MASSPGTAGAAAPRTGSYYTTVAAHELRRQRSMPAAFAPRGGGGGQWPRNLGNDDGGGEFRGCASAAGGVGAAVRALWGWVLRGRRKVLSRSGSTVTATKEQYGHEEYAQNFDEGAAAGETENLSRSFSARFARLRYSGQTPWDGAR